MAISAYCSVPFRKISSVFFRSEELTLPMFSTLALMNLAKLFVPVWIESRDMVVRFEIQPHPNVYYIESEVRHG